MGTLNRVDLIGNVGQDPKETVFSSGKRVVNFSVATTETWGSGEGKSSKTEWFDIAVWGTLGDTVLKYVKKGHQIYVSGKLQTQTYTAKDGTEKKKVQVSASSIVLLKQGLQREDPLSTPAEEDTAAPEAVVQALSAPSGDIPF